MTAIAATILKCHGFSLNIIKPINDANMTDVSLKEETKPNGEVTFT